MTEGAIKLTAVFKGFSVAMKHAALAMQAFPSMVDALHQRMIIEAIETRLMSQGLCKEEILRLRKKARRIAYTSATRYQTALAYLGEDAVMMHWIAEQRCAVLRRYVR